MPATGYSPTYGTTYTPLIDRNPLGRAFFYLGRKMRKERELLVTLIGAAAGSAALDTKARVAADRNGGGGVRTIEVVDIVDRNTAAADVTRLVNYLTEDTKIATPTNKAGSWRA